MAGRSEQVVHGGWTIAARHAGVVLGLLLLAPVLTNALETNREKAVRAGAAEVLDSRIPPLDKLRLAQDVLDEVERAQEDGKLPNVATVFEDRPDDDDYRSLLAGLQDQLDRAVTDAFSGPFLLAAALALAALVPVAIGRGGAAVRRALPLLVALGAVAAVLVPYLALGGATYEPAAVADPCAARDWRDPDGLSEVLEQIVLSALDGAACELGVVARGSRARRAQRGGARDRSRTSRASRARMRSRRCRTVSCAPSTTRRRPTRFRASSHRSRVTPSSRSRRGCCSRRSTESTTSPASFPRPGRSRPSRPRRARSAS